MEETGKTTSVQGQVCPLPLSHFSHIVMGHGSGGILTNDLVHTVFQKYFSNEHLDAGNDGALLSIPEGSEKGYLVTSTDAHIVDPLFFRGGDIGRLAVCGTVNDVAVMGAIPLFLTASFIIEEGFSLETLEKIAQSMQEACDEAGVKIVAGDTKVTQKGKGDGVYISTTGIGWAVTNKVMQGSLAKPGDAVIVSGNIGEHGIAVLEARGELGFSSTIQSDVAPLNNMIHQLQTAIPEIHVMRDPTRGGLATTLVEICRQSQVTIQLEEQNIPVASAVRKACDMLGFDPLYIANEGKVLIILPENNVTRALEVLHAHLYGKNAMRIGTVLEEPGKDLLLHTPFGSTRILNMLSGEMLPRIC